MHIIVIIPAFNEEDSVGRVIEALPKDLVQEVVVVNNASTDKTVENARSTGATVLTETRRGYGFACLCGIDYAKTKQPDVVVFLDGDFSDYPEEVTKMVQPIIKNEADFVLGSRMLGRKLGMAEKGALLPQAIFGNWLASFLMRLIWGARFTDLGPFRAIRFSDLLALDMQDQTYGWTIEMQIKALKAGLRYQEIPVSYRQRIGVSKVTGTVSGTLKASYKILWTIARFAFGG
jgi:glycosyltransferase involved in cell wall biosynthesis